MTSSTPPDAIARLEAISAPFDEMRVREYMSLVKQFVRDMRAAGHGNPFVDVCADFDMHLTADVIARLQAFIARREWYRRTVQDVCRWYVCDAFAMSCNLKPAGISVYEPAIQALEIGADFYQHHGDLCIRDLAAYPYGYQVS